MATSDSKRTERLTELQKEALQLFHARRNAKQIGRQLGISHHAVNERLRSARRALGVATSAEAAAILASEETGQPYNRVVYDAGRLLVPPDSVNMNRSNGAGPQPGAGLNTMREEQEPYLFGQRPSPAPKLQHLLIGRGVEDASRSRILLGIALLALAAIVGVGTLVTISSGISFIVLSMIDRLN